MFVNNRGAGVTAAASDENASSIAHSTKTPSQLKTPKRRAFGDISNRKPTTTNNNKKTPHIVPTTRHKKKETSSKIVPPKSLNRRHVSFALPEKKKTVVINEKLAPVEVSAGRTWSEQQDYGDDDGEDDLVGIWKEQQAWETEVATFCQEEQTRHLDIRKLQQEAHDQEYQEKLQALFQQDDNDLKSLLDDLVLESVPSFDDLSLGEDSLGPLDNDISF